MFERDFWIAMDTKMRDALPSELRPLFVVAYNVGCRLSELLNLQWDQVNLKDGVITLYAGETKNDEVASFRSRMTCASF